MILKHVIAAHLAALAPLIQARSFRNEPPKYSVQMSESIISRGQGVLTGENDRSAILQAGFVQKALHQVLCAYPNNPAAPLITTHVSKSVSSVVKPVSNATLDTTAYPLDRLSSGNGLVRLYEETGNTTYRLAFEALRTSIDLQPRNAQQGLQYWTYPYWSYLDGMYSFAPFLTTYTNSYDAGNASAIDDVIFQLDLLWQHCYNETSGLLVHGYDASRTAVWANNVRGASPHVWGRSLGWYSMALVDTLELLPKTALVREARHYIQERFQTLAAAIVSAVDTETGGWWQILDQPGRQGNYIESSASSMFAYSLLKGVSMGVLDNKNVYTQVAARAYEYIADTFVVDNGNGTLGWNGTVGVCSLNSTATYEYYVGQPILYNSVLGSAAFVLASLEYEKLNTHSKD